VKCIVSIKKANSILFAIVLQFLIDYNNSSAKLVKNDILYNEMLTSHEMLPQVSKKIDFKHEIL